MSKRFTTTLLEDDFGDLQLTIPYDICEEFGWDQTTEFEYEMSDDGSIHFKPLERRSTNSITKNLTLKVPSLLYRN